eukprot:12778822-Ditylum_brightwellii.AAC.1
MFLLAQDLQVQRDNYFVALYSHKVYHNTDKALVKQIMTAFDERFYKALSNAMLGYKNCTVADFLHHLHGNYGQITSTMIIDSEAKMSASFNPAAPIENLFAQISNGQDLTVAAGVPYLDIQLVTKTYDLIYKTGVHNDACKELNCRAMARKTYARLWEHFTTAHHELHQLQTAARLLGYTANNAKYIE